MKINIIQATTDHTGLIAPLFDAYRQFYEQPTNPDLARAYIHDRLSKKRMHHFSRTQCQQRSIGLHPAVPRLLFCRREKYLGAL